MADIDEDLSPPDEEGSPQLMPQLAAFVGIGVCAASIGSLERLFSELTSIGAAYLVAVQQADGLSVGSVVDVLTRVSSLPVRVAANGEAIAPDQIYVCGPEDMLTITAGHIAVRDASEPIGHRGTIDTLLIALAEHAHERTVAVLLRGLGPEGGAGVVATKKFGGLSIAELIDGETSAATEADGLSGVVDLRLPVERISAQIALYASNLTTLSETGASDEFPDDIEAQVKQITTILRNVTGHDFHGYKRGTFVRRVQRRMQVMQIDTVSTYVTRLREDRDEVQNLFQDLLIGVTQFFRDPQEFDALEREIPRLFAGKEPGDHLRVWVLGCATGEEAYSIAILLREHMATLDHPPIPQIFATDLDARALNMARAGRYTDTIAKHIRPDRLDRWFSREGDTFCVTKELREMCIFSPHNIVKDAPFSRIDILSCRNLLIYLNTDLQNRVIPIFHFSLRPAGVLFLGSSENVTRHQKLFAAVDRKNRVFRRLETATRIIPDFALSPRVRPTEPQGPSALTNPFSTRLTAAMGRQAEAIAARLAPAYIVVDAQLDVLHFSGRTGRYLEPSAGAATLNLLSLVHRDLRLDLRSALHRAATERRQIEIAHLALRDGDRSLGLNIIIEPVGDPELGALIVLFQDIGIVPEQSGADGERVATDEHVQRLDAELRSTRDRLQATIEELESTNEELKSSNEEYQSINEELQSASEEMETSKEELQSVNEELQTVNGELSHRVAELARANSDLKNLLESTQIATVFLDNDLRVRNFTPVATDVFHLLETDVGRPLDHVVSRVQYPELPDDVRRVLKTLVPIEREVIDPASNRHFVARVLPYRSVDNYISGAVVTFTDLTAVHKAEQALVESDGRYRAFFAASFEAVYRMNADWTEMRELDGRAFQADTPIPSATWLDTYVHPDDQPRVRDAVQQAVEQESQFELKHRVLLAGGSVGWTHSRAVPVLDSDGTIIEWLGTASDITTIHDAENALRASEERLRSAIEVARVGTWDWDLVTGDVNWSDQHFRMMGYPIGAVQPDYALWAMRLHPADRAEAEAALRQAREARRDYVHEFRSVHPDGAVHWLSARGCFFYDDDGEPVRMIGAMVDVTDAREQRERQTVLLGELQHRTRNLVSIIQSVADKTLRRAATLDEFRADFRGRLDALARVQGMLSRLEEHDRVTFDELLRTELAAHGVGEDDSARLVLNGPEGVRLRTGMVQMLALGIHELATNATKYGAFKDSAGRLEVRWRVLDEDSDTSHLEITWQERGVAMPVTVGPQGTGQGRELIERALPYQLDATTSYELGPDGVSCVIVIPISRSAP